MTIFKENDEVSIIDIDGKYNGHFRIVSPTNMTQSLVKSNQFTLVAIIEPLDADAFAAFLFEQTGIDACDNQENIHISIEPNRLQLVKSLI